MMKETSAVAILMFDLKSRKKTNNLFLIAEAANYLLKHQEWGIVKMKEFFNVSSPAIYKISRLHDLDIVIKKHVQKYNLSIETLYNIWRVQQLKNYTVSDILKIADVLKNMDLESVRSFMYHFLKNSDFNIAECVKLVASEKPVVIKLIAISFNSEQYDKLANNAKKEKIHISKYTLDILINNLAKIKKPLNIKKPKLDKLVIIKVHPKQFDIISSFAKKEKMNVADYTSNMVSQIIFNKNS